MDLSSWHTRHGVEKFAHFLAQKIRWLNCAPVQPPEVNSKLLMDNKKLVLVGNIQNFKINKKILASAYTENNYSRWHIRA